jgi:hypothetical protein
LAKEVAPAGNALAVVGFVGVRQFIDRVEQQHDPTVLQQFAQRRQLRGAACPFLCQPVARRRQRFARACRAVAVERHEEAQPRLPGFGGGAQCIDSEVEFEAAQQRALAATGRAEQHQRRLLRFGQHATQVVESVLLRLPVRPLRVRSLIDEQRQPREALVERVARLRPFGDSCQAVVFERARRVAEDLLLRCLVKLRNCLSREQRCAQDIECLRLARKAGLGRSARCSAAAGEARRAGRFEALATDAGEQCFPGSRFVESEQVDVGDRAQLAFRLAVTHPYRHEDSIRTGGILRKGGCPFGLGERRREIILGQDGDCLACVGGGAMHVEDEIAAGVEVPCLDKRAIAGVFELPGDPFRPILVGLVVANEEVALGIVHGVY